MKKTVKVIKTENALFSVLALPNTNYFKIEVSNNMGSNIEKPMFEKFGKNVYGLAHLVEHLSAKNTKDYSTSEFEKLADKYGYYNAYTNRQYVRYYHETTMENYQKSTDITLNFAMNNLLKVTDEEFNTERSVVSNEANMYRGNPTSMYNRNGLNNLMNLDNNDNIISDSSVIDTFTLDDAIYLKQCFLNNNDIQHLIVYDPTKASIDDIIQYIDSKIVEHREYNKKTYDEYPNIREELTAEELDLKYEFTKDKEVISTIETDQRNINIVVPLDDFDYKTASVANNLLCYHPNKVSLMDVIRNEHGLSYWVSLQQSDYNKTNTIAFKTDFVNGNEELVVNLFKESLNKSLELIKGDDEQFNSFIQTRRLKDAILRLDLEYFIAILIYSTEYLEKSAWDELVNELGGSEDLDMALDRLFDKYTTREKIISYVEKLVEKVNNEEYIVLLSKTQDKEGEIQDDKENSNNNW